MPSLLYNNQIFLSGVLTEVKLPKYDIIIETIINNSNLFILNFLFGTNIINSNNGKYQNLHSARLVLRQLKLITALFKSYFHIYI